MPNPLGMLSGFRDKIGYEPLLFLTLAFVALTFANQIPAGERDSLLSRAILLAAGCLFGVGVLIALLRVASVLFSHRPARGLIDGLAAGLLAGVAGGALGYGLHHVYRYPDGLESTYVEPAHLRVALCVLFATPVGGVIGVLIDMFHPDRQLPWRKYLGAVVIAVSIVFCLVGTGIFFFVPEMEGPGITVSDLQLLFEVHLFVLFTIVTVSFGWTVRRIMARLPVLIVAVLLARFPTFIMHSADPDQAGITLAHSQFTYTEHTVGLERIESANPDYAMLSITVALLMAWTCVSYGVGFKDHPVTRWLDQMFGVNHVATNAG